MAIGVGYAYTAMTVNEDNSTALEYITLKQEGTGKYKFIPGDSQEIYWDSSDYMKVDNTTSAYYTDYTLASQFDILSIDKDYIVVPVGKAFNVLAQPPSIEGVPAEEAVIDTGVDCELTTSGISAPTIDSLPAGSAIIDDGELCLFVVVKEDTTNSTSYFMASGDNQFKKYDASTHTWGTAANNAEFHIGVNGTSDGYLAQTITVYYGFYSNTGKLTVKSIDNSDRPMPTNNPITNATLTFKVTVGNEQNPGSQTTPGEVTGVVISDPTSSTMNVGDDLELTITVSPNDATNKSVFWTSSDNSVATVASGVVHAIAAGTVTITVTTVDGGEIDTIDLTVVQA